MELDLTKLEGMLSELKAQEEKIVKLNQELQIAMEMYKSKSKEYFGFADGDQLNVAQIFAGIVKVIKP